MSLTKNQQQAKLSQILAEKRRTDPAGLLKAQRENTLDEFLAADLAKFGLAAAPSAKSRAPSRASFTAAAREAATASSAAAAAAAAPEPPRADAAPEPEPAPQQPPSPEPTELVPEAAAAPSPQEPTAAAAASEAAAPPLVDASELPAVPISSLISKLNSAPKPAAAAAPAAAAVKRPSVSSPPKASACAPAAAAAAAAVPYTALRAHLRPTNSPAAAEAALAPPAPPAAAAAAAAAEGASPKTPPPQAVADADAHAGPTIQDLKKRFSGSEAGSPPATTAKPSTSPGKKSPAKPFASLYQPGAAAAAAVVPTPPASPSRAVPGARTAPLPVPENAGNIYAPWEHREGADVPRASGLVANLIKKLDK